MLVCASESLISRISPQKRIFQLNHFSLFVRGPRWVGFMEKKSAKKSSDTAVLTFVYFYGTIRQNLTQCCTGQRWVLKKPNRVWCFFKFILIPEKKSNYVITLPTCLCNCKNTYSVNIIVLCTHSYSKDILLCLSFFLFFLLNIHSTPINKQLLGK